MARTGDSAFLTTRLTHRNLAIVGALAGAAALVTWREGYLARVDAPFAAFALVTLLGAAATGLLWLTTRRLIALALVAGVFGLVTQRVGTGVGAWHYPGTYLFVAFCFAFGALFAFGAVTVLSNWVLPRRLHLPPSALGLVVLVAAVAILGHTGYGRDATFYVYYAVLVGFALLFAGVAHTQTILALVLASAGFGAVAEWLGARAGLWTYAGGARVPPLWLVAVSWPLEGIFHFGLSAIFAAEPPAAPRLRRREKPGQFRPRPGHPMNVAPATSRVVVRRGGDDKKALLDQVIDASGFLARLDAKQAAGKKSKGEFLVAVKPNFMFMYSKKDRSTFTDPELVEHLIARIIAHGYPNVAVVEAQSCYGNEFANRDVETVARHVGYGGNGYRIVDLTREARPYAFPAPLGSHPVGPTWRDADFRVSFAKNKTHTWAAYTLTIKNVYGALAMQDKLLEYHTRREIYGPTIQMLQEFPVDFGFIDAWQSADGTFGIFADREPQDTRAILGGENLVCVDWVGASMMGLDPMVSRYMQLAVQAFGRPEPVVDGDATPYSPWENVPEAVITTVDAAEEDYGFTMLVFSLLDSMDAEFPRRRHSFMWRAARLILAPLRRRLPFVTPTTGRARPRSTR